MTVISSRKTRFYKVVFPTIWFGFLGVGFVAALVRGEGQEEPMALIVPCIMALAGFFLFRKLLWGLVDEVRDGGDSLVIRRGSEEINVPLSQIMNISASTATNPPRVELRLDPPSAFGSLLVFSPRVKGFSFNPFRKNEIVEDLMVRVDKARRTHAR